MTKKQFHSLIVRACKSNYKQSYRRIQRIFGMFCGIPKHMVFPVDVTETLLEVWYEYEKPQQRQIKNLLSNITRDFDSQYGPNGLNTKNITESTIVSLINAISIIAICDKSDFHPPLWYRIKFGQNKPTKGTTI